MALSMPGFLNAGWKHVQVNPDKGVAIGFIVEAYILNNQSDKASKLGGVAPTLLWGSFEFALVNARSFKPQSRTSSLCKFLILKPCPCLLASHRFTPNLVGSYRAVKARSNSAVSIIAPWSSIHLGRLQKQDTSTEAFARYSMFVKVSMFNISVSSSVNATLRHDAAGLAPQWRAHTKLYHILCYQF